MKYLFLLVLAVSLTGCGGVLREEQPLYVQKQSTVDECIIYKDKMIQRRTITMETPIKKVQVEVKKPDEVQEDSNGDTQSQ